MDGGAQDYPYPPRKARTSLFDLLSLNTYYADENCGGIEDYSLRQSFKTAGQAFSVFDENTTDVIVPYGEGKELIAELCSARAEYDDAYRRGLLKKAGDYTVSLYQYQKRRLEE